MPLFMIERTFAEQLDLTSDDVKLIEEVNADEGVRWLFSFLSADRRRTYCLYEAPSPDAILAAARRANVPADEVVEVGAGRARSSPTACATGPPPSSSRVPLTLLIRLLQAERVWVSASSANDDDSRFPRLSAHDPNNRVRGGGRSRLVPPSTRPEVTPTRSERDAAFGGSPRSGLGVDWRPCPTSR